MKTSELIQGIEAFVQERLEMQETPGHDWHHICRVREMAGLLAQQEGADILVVELAALLHDIADHKFHGGDYEKGALLAEEVLKTLGADESMTEHVCRIVSGTSFSKGIIPDSIEGKCVQDADRLDALGAVGIARCFIYAGQKGHPMQDGPESAIQHFHDKLLLLKEGMHTRMGRKIANQRHRLVEQFLKEFEKETRTRH